MPQLAVLMPVYNAESFIEEAVSSVLAQTFTDFELWVIDDGSTDRTCFLLENYDDPRLNIVRNQRNIGLAASLNKGLTLTSAPFIARMDGDDKARPQRFERQMAFLKAHPDIDVCGSAFYLFPQGKKVSMPEHHEDIMRRHLFTTGVCHPSVIMKREVVLAVGGYPPYPCAQDYGLWIKLQNAGARFANLPEALLLYRVHGNSITHKKASQKQDVNAKIQRPFLEEKVGRSITEEELEAHHQLSVREGTLKNLMPVMKWTFLLLRKESVLKTRVLIIKNAVLWLLTSIKTSMKA